MKQFNRKITACAASLVASFLLVAQSPAHANVSYMQDMLLDEVAIATDELNLQLPQIVDEGLRLDRTAIEENVLVYHYSLLDQEAQETDRQHFASVMAPIIHEAVCESEELGMLIDSGIPVVYAYSGKFGNNISSIIVDTMSCEKFLQDLVIN